MNKDVPRDQIDQEILRTVKERKPKTVKELLDLVKERFPQYEKEIQNRVLHLESSGTISFKSKKSVAPHEFTAYLRTTGAYWYWIVLTVTMITTLVVFAIPENSSPFVYLRYALGGIFVLWLPGYSFMKALFPSRELDNIERVALSLGMSLALVPLVGLMLNYSPWGIRLAPIVFSLAAFTTTFATAAVAREYQWKQNTESSVVNR